MADSLSVLIAQREALERQIRDAQATAKSDAIAQIRKLMSEHGLTASDLVAKTAWKALGGSRKKVAAKYRDHESGATWTGRGLKPRWLTAALDSGKSIEEFVV